MADRDASAAYKAARSIGKKFLSDHANTEFKGYLPVLDDRVRDADLVGEINLGVREIPLNKILGTRTNARSNAFAGNFMPLLAENTEFGAKWCKLYASHIQEGIREPIKVYEYINRYFVQEGNKRVSVLRYCGAVTAYARVTRILPRRDESRDDVSIYYEFLDFDRREVFDNLWFSHRGTFTWIIETIRAWCENRGKDTTNRAIGDCLRSDYADFRRVYKGLGFASIPITTGDAYGQFLEIYGFEPDIDPGVLEARVRSCEVQFNLLSQTANGQTVVTTIDMKDESEKAPLSFFARRRQLLKIAFAFESSPERSLWTNCHDLARYRLQQEMGDKIEIATRYDVPVGEDSYPVLDKLLDWMPDILFATSPNMSTGLLRLSVEHPNTAILCCDGAKPNRNVMTYFPKLHEATWLAGILAGSMTATDVIGYMSPARFHQTYTANLNAFAMGARLVNPRVQILDYRMARSDAPEADHNEARRQMALRGADMAYCQHQLNTPLVRKGFPGVLSQLYMLDLRTGFPKEAIGAVALDWSVVYTQLASDCFTTKKSILDISRSGEDASVHFGWGIETGLFDVYGVDAFMGHNAIRLLKIFRDLLVSGQIRIFEGPIFDRDGVMQVEKGDTMSLLEIQSMNWYHEAIAEIIQGKITDC